MCIRGDVESSSKKDGLMPKEIMGEEEEEFTEARALWDLKASSMRRPCA